MALICAPASVLAADWPQWRGPGRNGVSAETGLLKRWPATGPPRVRTVNGLGEGYASVVVSDGRLVTIGKQGETVFARCFS
ncbi:MAG: polyvinylalcohol dehydrogenase, partial [Planctomycetaceae bacterium]